MRDWSLLAKGSGADIPDKELPRVAGPLKALEESFAPLAKSLTPGMEPSSVFRADGDIQ